MFKCVKHKLDTIINRHAKFVITRDLKIMHKNGAKNANKNAEKWAENANKNANKP